MDEFVKRTRIDAPAAAVFAWHERPDAIRKLIPPWEPVTLLKPPAHVRDGATAVLRLRVGPLSVRWVARHEGYRNRGEAGGEFTDVQTLGPFRRWEHRHLVDAAGDDACILEDRIRFELPMGPLGRLLGRTLTRRRLERMFDYRHRVTKAENEVARSEGPGHG
jgi:ligand-binding SRPBCC domain-containing protein